VIKPLDVSTWDAFARLVERHNGVFGGSAVALRGAVDLIALRPAAGSWRATRTTPVAKRCPSSTTARGRR